MPRQALRIYSRESRTVKAKGPSKPLGHCQLPLWQPPSTRPAPVVLLRHIRGSTGTTCPLTLLPPPPYPFHCKRPLTEGLASTPLTLPVRRSFNLCRHRDLLASWSSVPVLAYRHRLVGCFPGSLALIHAGRVCVCPPSAQLVSHGCGRLRSGLVATSPCPEVQAWEDLPHECMPGCAFPQ
jgi:hypothetical protein